MEVETDTLMTVETDTLMVTEAKNGEEMVMLDSYRARHHCYAWQRQGTFLVIGVFFLSQKIGFSNFGYHLSLRPARRI
jgi:hypothetical protein